MNTTYDVIYPLWVRLWHASHGLLTLALIVTGASLHFSGEGRALLDFRTSVLGHNAIGVAYVVSWGVFAIANSATGNLRHYLPRGPRFFRRVFNQAVHYAWGMLRGKPAPFRPRRGRKLNPAQQATYLFVMYGLMPALCGSGLLLLFPNLAPETVFGFRGLWPMAILHLSASWILVSFTVLHIYLATTGPSPTTLYREMITGSRSYEDNKPVAPPVVVKGPTPPRSS